ncbi:MAG: LPS export ABC transporter ATP-binding protein [Fimbriimonadaceae bacterium]
MIIRAEHLVKSYRGRKVVNDVSVQVEQGEIVGLLGPNGAGKTTTFYMITGLVKPNQGHVRFDDALVTKWPMYRRARAGVGYLPQEPSVFRKLNVLDNMRMAAEIAKVPRAEAMRRIEELSEELHITRLLRSPASVLSGGERRRVEIARSLVTGPKFLLLDEPFTGIDPVTIEEIQQIIFRLKHRNIGVLITDHNVAATLRITDRNYILTDGQILREGSSFEIGNDPVVRKHYLGDQFDSRGLKGQSNGESEDDE